MFRRIFITLKNKKYEYIRQNILFLENKLFRSNIIKRMKSNPQERKDNNNNILFKNNKESNFYDYPVKVLK